MASPPPNSSIENSACSHEAWLKSFPPGYRFKPRDEELVIHYLKKKLYNQELPPNLIMEVELYQYDPLTLVEESKLSYGEGEWYFFTPREKKYRNGSRPRRAAADGYWKATGADRPLRWEGEEVGSRKALVFYKGKPPKGDKTEWMMHEFRLKNPPARPNANPDDMRLDDWVLCKIYKKIDKTSKSLNARQAPPTEEEVDDDDDDDQPTPISEISEIQELEKPIPISQAAWGPLNYGGGVGGAPMVQMDQTNAVSFPTSLAPAYNYYDDESSILDPTALFLDDNIPDYYDPLPNLLLPLPSLTTSFSSPSPANATITTTTTTPTSTSSSHATYPNFGYSSQFFNSFKKQP